MRTLVIETATAACSVALIEGAAVVASALLGPLAYVTGSPGIIVVGALIVAAIVIERHRANLVRVAAGIERRIGQRA